MGPQVPEPAARDAHERDAEMADSVGAALLVVLETLAPAERLAFVLHDMFAVPFEEIAPIVGRTPAAARQLASRARRRVQGTPQVPEADLGRQRQIVEAFLAASRDGDFEGLLAVLDPDVVFRADPAAQRLGSLAEIRGAAAVAETFKGRAQAAKPALVDGRLRSPSSWAANCASCCASRSPATGSQRWKRWPMPGGLAGSTWRCCSDNRRQADLDPAAGRQ